MSEKQKEIGLMFDRIAKTYDVTNRVLSLGQDVKWRKKLARMLPHERPIKVLDIACGTGDVLFCMHKERPNILEGIGIDIAANMISFAEEKSFKLGLSQKFSFMKADACNIPFPDNCFDVVSVSFGIRNVVDIKKALDECQRVLKSNGRLHILEFSLPQNFLIKNIYLTYFRHVLPFIGGFISKDYDAYKYLNNTVESFYTPDSFSHVLKESNFKEVSYSALTFGVAYIYSGRKI